jgi:hypothetical protein
MRALQSSLADAKVEVEFWKRKVDDLSTRLTESQIEKRRLEDAQKATAAGAKQQGAAQHASSSASSDERLRIGALELQLKTLQHTIDAQTSKALHVKTCVSNTVTRLALKVADADKQLQLSLVWGAWVLMTSVQRDQKKLNRVLDLSRHKQVFAQLRVAAVAQKAHANGAGAPSAPANRFDDAVKGSEPKHDNNLELLYIHPPSSPSLPSPHICRHLSPTSLNAQEHSRYRMSQQRCGELEGRLQQLQQQHRASLQTNPANVIEAARASAIADLEQVRVLIVAAVFVSNAFIYFQFFFYYFLSLLSSSQPLTPLAESQQSQRTLHAPRVPPCPGAKQRSPHFSSPHARKFDLIPSFAPG